MKQNKKKFLNFPCENQFPYTFSIPTHSSNFLPITFLRLQNSTVLQVHYVEQQSLLITKLFYPKKLKCSLENSPNLSICTRMLLLYYYSTSPCQMIWGKWRLNKSGAKSYTCIVSLISLIAGT